MPLKTVFAWPPILFFAALLSLGSGGCGSSSAPVDASVPRDLSVADLEPAPPLTLAPARTLTACLAVDNANVYWADGAATTSGGAIMKVPLAGGAATPVVMGVDERTCVTTLGDGNLYYDTASTDADLGTGNTIWKAPATNAGGAGATALLKNQRVLTGKLQPAAPYLYWATDTLPPGDPKQSVVRFSTTTGTGPEVVIPDVTPPAGDVVVSTDTLFWADRGGVFSRPLAMTGAAPLAYGLSSIGPTRFATDGNHVVVLEVAGPMSGDLALFKKDGSGKVLLSPTLLTPLAVDDKGVYVKLDNRLERLSLDGKSATILAEVAPRALALDATSIYFTDGTAILKLPR